MQIDERIEQAVIRLMNYYPAVSPIMMSWDIQADNETVPTMGTDYSHLYYNTEFLATLSREQVPAVIVHEIFHCVFLHPTDLTQLESKGRDQNLWSIAAEIVVNATVKDLIKDTPFKLPGQPFDPLVSNNILSSPQGEIYFYSPYGLDHSTAEVYEALVKRFPKDKKEYTVLATMIGEESSDQGNRVPLVGDVKGDKSKEAAEKAIAVMTEMKKQRGDLPAALKRLLDSLTTPKISWKKLLHGMLIRARDGLEDASRVRHNTRRDYGNDIIIPETIYRTLDNVVVVLDTSGSISKTELTEFISELQTLEYIVPEYTVMTADAKVHEIVKVKDLKELVSKIKFEGGGGTDFRDVFQKVKKCNVMIFFTDGYTTYPENPPGYPVLWVLTKNNEKPPWGIVAHILDD
jgi:predicted metal-dependent peptidase